ncbi:MAG TPA: hypothetical protein DEP05_07765 [Betaproteobacteria bacterium]|nr:hypothetical protein [Betaproteobacteria bacterium]
MTIVKGRPVVTLPPAVLAASGVVVRPLTVTRRQPQISAAARVLPLQPLIERRAHYQQAAARRQAATTSLAASRRAYRRARQLNRQHQNISDQMLDSARNAYAAALAAQRTAASAASALQLTMRQRWGAQMTQWLTHPHGTPLPALFSGALALLEVTLSPGSTAPPARIQLENAGGGSQPAHFIASSPEVDPKIQGPTYLFYTARNDLRANQRLTAMLPAALHPLRGVVIPSTAVIWYASQAWAYVRTGKDQFTRRAVPTAFPVAHGWFAAKGWRGGDDVVVAGAPLLLAEELQPPQNSAGGDGGDDDDD